MAQETCPMCLAVKGVGENPMKCVDGFARVVFDAIRQAKALENVSKIRKLRAPVLDVAWILARSIHFMYGVLPWGGIANYSSSSGYVRHYGTVHGEGIQLRIISLLLILRKRSHSPQ